MAISQAPTHHFYFSLQTIVGSAADSIMHLYQQLTQDSEQHTLLALCANLYKAEAQLTEELRLLNVAPPEIHQPTFEVVFQHLERTQCRRVLLDSIVQSPVKPVHSPPIFQ